MPGRPRNQQQAQTRLWTSFACTDDRTFEGFVVDQDRPESKFIIEVLLDGEPVRTLSAHAFSREVREAGVGDGRHGFSFTLSNDDIFNRSFVEVRVANFGTLVGRPIALASSSRKRGASSSIGLLTWVEWAGGLKLTGWITDCGNSTEGLPAITAVVGTRPVAEAKPSSWRHIKSDSPGFERASAFTLYLPAEYANGRVHRIKVLMGGKELQGSPVTLIAFKDGLSNFLASTPQAEEHDWLRARFFDNVMPMSMPFSEYADWCARFATLRPRVGRLPSIAVALVGHENPRTFDSLDQQTHQNWIAASIPGVAGELTFARDELLEFLTGDAAGDEFVFLVPSGTTLAEAALERIASAVVAHPEARAIYGDIEILDGKGQPWPLFFPAFDYERMLEQGYCANLFAARRETVRRAVEDGANTLQKVFFALLDDGAIDPSQIVHLPGALGTLPRLNLPVMADELASAARQSLEIRGMPSAVEPTVGSLLPAVRARRIGLGSSASVSILIATRNRVDLLRPCLDSIQKGETKHIEEVIVIDNDSSDPETLDFLADRERSAEVRVLRAPGPFNFSRLNNRAVVLARAPNICLLNNDVEVVSPDWLGEMLGRLADPMVGAVGALLVWPSGVVQHGGVVLGTRFAADHAFTDRLEDDPGYSDLLRVAHQCSAVTAACLLTRKEDYFAVGGLDEQLFPVNFNDVDFCLRLRAQGKRVVFTPHAKLLHHESVSRGLENRPDRIFRARRELAALRARWPDVLLNDPFYSPALGLDPKAYTGLAWPPRPLEPRIAAVPIAVEIPPGF